jgi:hypothetical protein
MRDALVSTPRGLLLCSAPPSNPSLVFAPKGLRVAGADEEVMLPWDGDWSFCLWSVRARRIPYGFAVRHAPAARGAFAATTAIDRIERWWRMQRDVVPVRTRRFDRRPEAFIHLVTVFRRFLVDRPQARAALSDRARVDRLVIDVQRWPGPRRKPRPWRGARVREVEHFLRYLGYQHQEDEPMPDWVPPDVEAVVGEVMRRIERDPAYDVDAYRPVVQRLAEEYVDARPWPFGALVDPPLSGLDEGQAERSSSTT